MFLNKNPEEYICKSANKTILSQAFTGKGLGANGEQHQITVNFP